MENLKKMNISAILNNNGSDKCYSHTYHLLYDDLIAGRGRDDVLDILESGVEHGGSLSAWKEYFPNARVTGVDIVDTRFPKFVRDDVEFIISDIKNYKPDRKFDLIVEDGDHSNHDALWSAVNLSTHLKPSGVLVIEDIQEGFIIPTILWGKLNGHYLVYAIDMRRLTLTHDNFLLVIKYLG